LNNRRQSVGGTRQ